MSTQDDTAPLIDPRDVPAALGLLSRLPIPVNTDHATARGAKAAWAYPIAGLAIGLVACVIAQICLLLGIPSAFAAGFALATLVIVSGAMHEDGLADCADGFWGGWDRENRLRIMKDSHIGAYGTIALILSLGLRWAALTAVISSGLLWPVIIAIAMLSRAAMVPVMALVPNARASGLSRSVGRPNTTTAAIAVAVAVVAALLLLQVAGVWLILWVGLGTLGCVLIARSKIGGQTGDVLGATQQIAELAGLITLVTLLP